MKALDEMKWEAFDFSEIFDITATKSGVDKCRLEQKPGCVPYITRTDKNNGWDNFVGVQKYQRDSANVITIGLDTQTVFYQPIPFYTGQNIQILTSQHLNKYVALFLIPLIKIQMKKFNWGGNGATLGRLKRLKLVLPVSTPHIPDYEYMCEYSKYIEHQQLEKHRSHLQEIQESEKCNIDIHSKNWKPYFLNDIFTIDSGVRLTKNDMIDGNTPFIGSSDSNNGITAFICNDNKSKDSNVLGVNYNGSVVENFYHPYKALFSDDVKRLHFRHFQNDKYAYLFVKQAILQQKCKFEYGYKFNGERMSRQKILLPVDSTGNVDYDFMSRYMRSIESAQLQKYIEKKLNKSMRQY